MSTLNLALVGNPNCGKTALFNRLTGARQKVANYPGVTVERKEGFFETAAGATVRVLDLPGTYSLQATSPDEEVTRQVCTGTHATEATPDLLVCVVDATNLRLHLRFVLELLATGRPMVLALNMVDQARRLRIRVDTAKLSEQLGIPVVETVALKHGGVQTLRDQLERGIPPAPAVQQAGELDQRVRDLLAACVDQPQAQAPWDQRLDAWLLHPVLGLVTLAARRSSPSGSRRTT